MEHFTLHILGCGSALPTLRHHPSSQVLSYRGKLYMIDCGEGTQQQFRRAGLSFAALHHIFISHLHGDHIFGLMGLISTLSLLGRTSPLYVHAHASLAELLRAQLHFCCQGMGYEVRFEALPSDGSGVVYADRSLSVEAVKLQHRVPCVGFVFREARPLPHMRPDMIRFLNIPHYAIAGIKQGEGFTDAEGTFWPHERLTMPSAPARSYAYISDTLPLPANAPSFEGVDLLYHEATFAEADAARAVATCHTTASQAAAIAATAKAKRLLIGHFSARYPDEYQLLNEAQAVFPNTLLAREGMTVEVGEELQA